VFFVIFLLFFVVFCCFFVFFVGFFVFFFVIVLCLIYPIYFVSHSQILHLFFQFAGEMSNSHMYKFPQNNLYSYNMIADSLRKIHTSENREKITTKVDIPTCKLILW
jgi:hypothetical protein